MGEWGGGGWLSGCERGLMGVRGVSWEPKSVNGESSTSGTS